MIQGMKISCQYDINEYQLQTNFTGDISMASLDLKFTQSQVLSNKAYFTVFKNDLDRLALFNFHEYEIIDGNITQHPSEESATVEMTLADAVRLSILFADFLVNKLDIEEFARFLVGYKVKILKKASVNESEELILDSHPVGATVLMIVEEHDRKNLSDDLYGMGIIHSVIEDYDSNSVPEECADMVMSKFLEDTYEMDEFLDLYGSFLLGTYDLCEVIKLCIGHKYDLLDNLLPTEIGG